MYDLLHGLRVVEAASFIAAPSCALHMAQMGAEVIRIDQAGGGPDFHRWPLAPGGGASLYWEGLNKGKKSVALDLSRPEGRELAAAIITAPGEAGGLFVTNYPGGRLPRLRPACGARPDLICLRVMGWPDGRPAVDYTVNSAVGVPLMTGPVGARGPVNHVLPAWDLLAGAYGAFCLLAAERARRRRRAGPGDPAAAVRRGARQHGPPRADRGGAVDRGGPPAPGQRAVRRLRPRFRHRGRQAADGGGHHAAAMERAGRDPRPGAPVAAIEAELGVSFARDEGLRFVHRARLLPLFDAAFARQDAAS